MPKFTLKSLHSDTLDKMGRDLNRRLEELKDKVTKREVEKVAMELSAPIVLTIKNIGEDVIEGVMSVRINKDKNMTDAQKVVAIAALKQAIDQCSDEIFEHYSDLFHKVTGKAFDFADDSEMSATEHEVVDGLVHGKIDLDNLKDLAQETAKEAVANTDASAELEDNLNKAIDGKPGELVADALSSATNGESEKVIDAASIDDVLHGKTSAGDAAAEIATNLVGLVLGADEGGAAVEDVAVVLAEESSLEVSVVGDATVADVVS